LDRAGSSTSTLATLPEVLTVSEAAAILRVGRNQLYQAVASGQLGALHIGRSIRIPNKPCWTCSPRPAPRPPAAMSSRGNLQRKCVKGHPKPHGRCSGRCIRYYPRLELPHAPDGTRTFEALGGYPTRSQAEAALADRPTGRRSHGLALDPAKLTVDQYLDRWLSAPACAPGP
jgi:excisionase family DNA binding protein